MKILVTGGSGYLGHVLCPLLREERHKVRVLDNLMYRQGFPDGVEEKKGSITSVADMYEATEGVDAVIALAAIVGDEASEIDKEATIYVNYEATKLLVEMCEMNNVGKLVFASTCSVYGDSGVVNETGKLAPLSLYAKTRVMSERVLVKSRLVVETLRLGTLFGWSERMRFDLVANYMTAKAMADGEITVHGGDQSRPMLHVSDAAQLLALFATSATCRYGVAGVVFSNYTIKEVAQIVAKKVGGVDIKYEGKSDKRDYHIKPRELYGYAPKMTLTDGVEEMKDKMSSLSGSYTDDKYYNTKAWRK